ncbi:MAG: hypothetical protein Q4A64_03440 [Porphyromonadaceae bacterium]|nr:hypothetical protein [Porphyromonadaceae bacterium]
MEAIQTVRNPKKVEIAGDYNLVVYNDEVIGMILVAEEKVRADFLVYKVVTKFGYDQKLHLQSSEEDEVGGFKLAKTGGKWLMASFYKRVGNRNNGCANSQLIHKDLIKIESCSAVTQPLNLTWTYSWVDKLDHPDKYGNTRERKTRYVPLHEEGFCIIPEREITKYTFECFAKTLKIVQPKFKELFAEETKNKFEAIFYYDNSLLIHVPGKDFYAWYNRVDGQFERYAEPSEWYEFKRSFTVHKFDYDQLSRIILREDLPLSRRNDDEEPEPRRIRRGRSGERRERLAQQEAAEAEHEASPASSTEE